MPEGKLNINRANHAYEEKLAVTERIVMSQKHIRYSLKSKEAKQIITQASEKLKTNLESVFGSKANVETVEADFGQILLINGKPVLFKIGDVILPTLLSNEILAQTPKVVVDMGAVRFVCNGADVMAPGIVRYEGEFSKGDVVLVVDEKHGKPLALGEILYSSEEAKTVKQGAVVKNFHYVSDKVWNVAKTLTE
jgi:PUA domain protein